MNANWETQDSVHQQSDDCDCDSRGRVQEDGFDVSGAGAPVRKHQHSRGVVNSHMIPTIMI